MPQVATPVRLPSGMTLEELNYKHPTCSTCRFRTMRQTGRGKKTGHMAWCDRHSHPVEYETFTGPDGKPWIAGDRPCPDYAYVGSSPFSGERRLLHPDRERACQVTKIAHQ